ncbi:hypothetical protein ACFL6U_31200 [Planctomycetota bacterium]
MKNHEKIEQRSLLMAQAIVAKIDEDPNHAGLKKAQQVCRRWADPRNETVIQEWLHILAQPWESIRKILLSPSEESRRLRQSSPFCGILSPQERWTLYKAFSNSETN